MAGKTRRSFGRIEKRGNRYRVGFVGPDGVLHWRPQGQVANKGTAEAWLAHEESLIEASRLPGAAPWASPVERAAAVERTREKRDGSATLREYVEASRYLDRRRVKGLPLKARTHHEYQRLLDACIYPTLGDRRIGTLTRDDIEAWFDGPTFQREDGDEVTTLSTTRARAYDLLRAILRDAVDRSAIESSPATIKGGGEATRKRQPVALTLPQVAALADAMPEHLSAAVYVAARCGLRQGELFALRRQDIETRADESMVIHVRRNVTRVRGRVEVGTPKTAAGRRTVPVPRAIARILRDHVEAHAAAGPDGLVFPPRNAKASEGERYMAPASLYGRAGTDERPGHGFYEARRVIGLDELTWHDLRHTFATLAAQTPGMSLTTLQYLGGWTAPAMAMRYAHYMQDTGRALLDSIDNV